LSLSFLDCLESSKLFLIVFLEPTKHVDSGGSNAWLLKTLQVTVEEKAYHKSCFKCSHGGCAITPSNYAALEGILYCKHHFSQLFKEKGSYNHLIKCASVKRAAEAQPEQPASDSS
jgi:cysteine/glycine-rich protein